MKKTLSLLLLIIVIFSCKSKQQTTKVDSSIFNRNDTDSLFVTIFHSQCFGRCPWYEAKIYESGYVVYSGKKDVANIGNYSFQISTEQLKELKQKADEVKYFQMKAPKEAAAKDASGSRNRSCSMSVMAGLR